LSIHAGPQKNVSKIKFVNPNADNYERNIRNAAALNLPCIKKDQFTDKPIVIVAGSGPTLTDPEVLADIRAWVDKGAIIFACKAAIKILYDAGFTVDYAVSMDPGAHIAAPNKIYKAPGTTHIIASSSDPELFEYLKDEKVMIFHSATGYKDEVKLYNELFETSTCMGGGYNVVNRAVSAAFFMGAGKIVLAGTDCGWRKDQEMYADGPAHRAGVDMSDHGIVDGREWMTRPDMLASGVALAKLAKKREGDIVFLGDTLPSKLVLKDDAFLDTCASFNK
jgi:hypothetical protein